MIREMTEGLKSGALNSALSSINSFSGMNSQSSQDLEQNIHIDANFPNVKDASDIFRKNTEMKDKIDSRFNELKKNLDGISQKVLTDSLRSMEEDGIITRTVYPEVPPRVEYALSDVGESMRPILTAMQEWGTNYKKS